MVCMDAKVWWRIEELFHTALGVPVAEREGWLDAACEGDAAVREQVQGMLDADEGGRNPLEHVIRAEAALIILRCFSSRGVA